MVRTSKPNQDPGEKKSLSGAVALITGGSRGIGRAIARQLAILGASVAICGRDIAALEEAALDVAKLGVPVHSQVADIAKSGDIADFVAKTETELGPITILVNNAGIGLFGPAHEKTEADWDRVLTTNLKSVFLVSRAVAPSMIRRGSGDIINISSLAAESIARPSGASSGSPAAWRKISASTAFASAWFAREASPRNSRRAAQRTPLRRCLRRTSLTPWKPSLRKAREAS